MAINPCNTTIIIYLTKIKMKHFSHPHSLVFSESPEKDGEEEIMCSGCEQKLSSPYAYTCTERKCDFVLHKSCFELPKITEHKSHPKHQLTLLSEPPEDSIYYGCRACDSRINCFSYSCHEWDRFRLHVKCASLAESVQCKAHSHALELRYETPTLDDRYMICCNVCDGGITEGIWSYFCKECDFNTHLECVFSAKVVPDKKEEEEEEDEEKNEEAEAKDDDKGDDDEGMTDEMRLHNAHIRAMDQMAMINLQRQLNQMNANFIANMFRTKY